MSVLLACLRDADQLMVVHTRDKADNKQRIPTLFAIQQPQLIQPPGGCGGGSRFLAFCSQLCCQWLGLPITAPLFPFR
jgi:hypothetical protein